MRRIDCQFDDLDNSYRVETLETVSGFNQTWSVYRSRISLRAAELMRSSLEREGETARVRHESDY